MNWIVEHVTLPYVLTLIAGMCLGVALGMLSDHLRRRAGKPVRRQSPMIALASAVIVLAMIWIMVSVAQARNCALNLNVAVAQEQVIAKIERDSFAKAIVQSQAVPSEIQDLPRDDPRRNAVMDPITNEYLAQQAKAAKMREENAGLNAEAQRACQKVTVKRCKHCGHCPRCGGAMQLLKSENRDRTEWLHVREGEPPTRVCPNPETIGEWAAQVLDVAPSGRHAKPDDD